MSSLIKERILEAGKQGRCAFIPYMTAGFPNTGVFMDIIDALEENGADVIEIGLPFSDPIADGKVIQQSSTLALKNGMTPPKILDITTEISKKVKSPLIIMTYWNPILRMGPARFAQRAADAGVSGVIIPDLPPDEADEWIEASDQYGLDTIFMVAPTTTLARQEKILKLGGGFIYYVSLTGVTGADLTLSEKLKADVKALRKQASIPVSVGFGVSTPDHARGLAGLADGAIVGTALIRQVLAHERPEDQVTAVAELAGSLSRALVRTPEDQAGIGMRPNAA